MTIARMLEGRPAVVTCDADDSVAQAAALLAERRIGAVPVIAHGAVVGIFSERDLLYRIADQGAAVLERRVREVMTAPPMTVEPNSSVLAALSLMTMRRIRHLPVMEHGEMIGFVSIGDLVKCRMDKIETEAEAMREYIQTA